MSNFGEKKGDGKLILKMGCMFAAKTTSLLASLERYKYAKKRVLYVNSARDVRSESAISTHAPGVPAPSFDCIKVDELMSAPVEGYDVIGVDEAQFFPDLVNFCLSNEDKILVVVGLDGSFDRKGMGQILQLIPLADEYHKLTAVCSCGADAIFTRRFGPSQDEIDIGGSDKYEPVCRKCYSKLA